MGHEVTNELLGDLSKENLNRYAINHDRKAAMAVRAKILSMG